MAVCGDSPDTSGINDAARANADVAREALAWYKQTYADEAPLRAEAAATAKKVSDAQVQGMQFATDQARELDAYNKATFRPAEQKFVQEAGAYDTPERRMQAAAEAATDVDTSAAAVRQANDRALARSGIAPGSAKALALAEDSAVKQAAVRGGAMTNAVRNVEQQGYSRMADVVSLGRGLAPTQATQQQIATRTGNSGVANATQALQNATSGTAMMGQGFGTAISGNASAGNLFASAAKLDQDSQNQMMSGLTQGAVAAGQLGWKPFSDKNVKSGTGRMADQAKALKEVEATPVHAGWKYDPAKGGPDDGGQPHDGPMAQDVRKTMGEAAAPGGKVIDLVTMNGRMMAAIQALAKDVKALKKEDQREKEAA